MRLKHPLYLFFCCVIIVACKTDEKRDEKPLARVGQQFLYPSDIEGIGEGMSTKDSLYQLRIHIDQWIRDALMLQVAEANINVDDKIERRVADYRATLIMNEYEKALINERLEEEVTPQQLAEYYATNKDQYKAGVSWVRCHFVKAPRDAKGLSKLRRWFKSKDGANFERVKLFCAKNETVHILNESLWVKYDKVARQIPEGSISRRHRSGKSILDKTDDEYIYLLQIFEYRDKDDAVPLSKVQSEIRRIILHQRRNRILQSIRKEVYEKAKKENQFEIF